MKARIAIATMAIGLWVTGILVAPAAMAVELDFNISAPTSGTITYGGSGGALVGSNIEVDNVVGLSTPANENVTALCVSCVLNFNTGALVGSGPGGGVANGSNNGWWSFGSGGMITITGGVQLQGGTDIALGSTLLNGSFNSAFVQDLGVQGFKVTFGTFNDTKNDTLLSYFGLTPGMPFQGALTLLFGSTNPGVGGAFTSTSVFSGNVVNSPVPLPAAALLFGSGLVGLAGALRKKLSLA
jgi:hypothetical protein